MAAQYLPLKIISRIAPVQRGSFQSFGCSCIKKKVIGCKPVHFYLAPGVSNKPGIIHFIAIPINHYYPEPGREIEVFIEWIDIENCFIAADIIQLYIRHIKNLIPVNNI